MSLYNVINGFNSAVLIILPMLGKNPREYPRFRDCFVIDEKYPKYDNHIHIFTRIGGNNRIHYRAEIKEMEENPNYITNYDDLFDSTYATWIFSIPEKWKPDFDLILKGEIPKISDEYKDELHRVYPLLKTLLNDILK